MKTNSPAITFYTISIDCGHDDLIEYPQKLSASMSRETWQKMVNSLNNIEFRHASIEIQNADGDMDYDTLNEDGQPIDLYEFDDPLEFRCWKLHKPYADKPILFAVLQAKYHDTLITYELAQNR